MAVDTEETEPVERRGLSRRDAVARGARTVRRPLAAGTAMRYTHRQENVFRAG